MPPELIAQVPAEPRDSSRLLVVHRESGRFEHRVFRDLPEYVDANDLLVANDTKVIRARLLGQRLLDDGSRGGKVEFLMIEELAPRRWEGPFHASAKGKVGLRFEVPTPDGLGLRGTVVRGSVESVHGMVVVEFDRDPVESGAGEMPLPPYIASSVEGNERAVERYQTIYASGSGSAAAPTAGLHFTESVLEAVKARGAGWAQVTLNVGLGTFRPVKAEDVREHVMHEERYAVSEEAARRITAQKEAGKRVLAVGTTAVRTLEAAWNPKENRLPAGIGRTALFIRPGEYEFQVVDRLLTNFHLPKSTLLMLVGALMGYDLMRAAYAEAIRERYRFFSYGDAMLIL